MAARILGGCSRILCALLHKCKIHIYTKVKLSYVIYIDLKINSACSN